jgi:small nuclear ribonucleoprotein (snRNP)-like protein
MSVAPVLQFFSNKINIQLKSGQRFEGLLSRVDYKTNTVILEDVEDLGNDQDKNCVPHDKKIPEKEFQAEIINEIFLKEKHFSEPKKYKKEEFWDAISEPQPKEKQFNKYEGNRDQRREDNRRDYKPRKQYEERGQDKPYRPREERGQQDKQPYRPREDRNYRKYEERKPKEEEDER